METLTFTQEAKGNYVSDILEGNNIVFHLVFPKAGATIHVEHTINPEQGWYTQSTSRSKGKIWEQTVVGLLPGQMCRIRTSVEPSEGCYITA